MPQGQNPLPIPQIPMPETGRPPNWVPEDWCGRHQTLCNTGRGIKTFFTPGRGCGKGQPGPQDPVWPWGWVYDSTDWIRDRKWCEGGKNCDSPRREMTRWVVNRYKAVFGDAAAQKLTDQDVRDMVVHYGRIGKHIYPNNLPCGETKFGKLADSIRKAALARLEDDLRSGAFRLGRNNSPADRQGGSPSNPPSTGTGNLPAPPLGAGFSGWVAVIGIGALAIVAFRGGFK